MIGSAEMGENSTSLNKSPGEFEVIPPGKLKCYISGKLRKNTPEERVRQDVARSLVEVYGYNRKQMDVEFSIKMGRSRKRADIVIFDEEINHTQENIYSIIEVKPEKIKPSDKKEGIHQLESYVAACPNCSFAIWVGNERLAFKSTERKGKRALTKIPDIPKMGEPSIPIPTREDLKPAIDLKQTFKRIHNYIFANQGFQKDKAFEELQKIIFIKVYDEQYSPTLQFYILPDESISEVRNRLINVFKKVRKRYKYIFKGNEDIELNNSVLEYIVSELYNYSLVDTETDVKGEAYEQIVGSNLRGDRGEFFTPRTVCNMTVEMIFSLFSEEKLTSPGGLKILDPAAGTGGFLILCVQKIKELFSEHGLKYDRLRDSVKGVAETNLFGIDFNPFLVKVTQMNMVMHGDGSSNIVNVNSLENPSEWNKKTKENIELGSFDIVVTNPPFGADIPIDDPQILDQFELTTFNSNSSRKSLPPEQLFVERCLKFLKPGGYLGIVLPDSILSNPGLVWLREWILKKAFIVASIDLPIETFLPHVGVQTSILILQKKTIEQEKYHEEYEIFMAMPQKIGHDRRGKKIFKSTPEGEIELDDRGLSIIDDQLPIVVKMFKKWIKEKGRV
jgi:type I restriction enzyme M protein